MCWIVEGSCIAIILWSESVVYGLYVLWMVILKVKLNDAINMVVSNRQIAKSFCFLCTNDFECVPVSVGIIIWN